MDIYIIYIVKALLLPLASLLLLSIAGLFFLSTHKPFAMILIGSSLALLLLLSLPIVAEFLANTQEIHPALNNEEIEIFAADAIVVLGGGLKDPAPEYSPKVTLKAISLVRVRYAALLAKQTQLPVLVTGGKVLSQAASSEADIMTEVLQNEFNQKVTWQEDRSRNTAENAYYTHQLLSAVGIKRIILVTHAFHMRRAATQFQLQGFEVLPAPTAFIGSYGLATVFDFLPSSKALHNSTYIIHEVIGRFWYWLRY
ncbi:MAG: YdcF family protein [Methyloprofundus sp.]|nr:YdcF family protein [Methyloprofundus sp.]